MARPTLALRMLGARFGWRCHYCNCKLRPETATRDHIVPRKRMGGADSENITLACVPCNSHKSDKPYDVFCRSKWLHERKKIVARNGGEAPKEVLAERHSDVPPEERERQRARSKTKVKPVYLIGRPKWVIPITRGDKVEP